MPNTRSCLIEGRDDCQQLKPKGSHTSFVTTVIALTILLMLSILFGRVTVNVVKEAMEYKLERLNTTLIRSIYNTPIYNRLMYCPGTRLTTKSTSD